MFEQNFLQIARPDGPPSNQFKRVSIFAEPNSLSYLSRLLFGTSAIVVRRIRGEKQNFNLLDHRSNSKSES
ncbi:MAG TPA: hypothetical protein VGN95_03165 [Pyrinomonadaceae bacterium]|nr:hypothetical protein [Pyrinomonadaceae bacterium]